MCVDVHVCVPVCMWMCEFESGPVQLLCYFCSHFFCYFSTCKPHFTLKQHHIKQDGVLFYMYLNNVVVVCCCSRKQELDYTNNEIWNNHFWISITHRFRTALYKFIILIYKNKCITQNTCCLASSWNNNIFVPVIFLNFNKEIKLTFCLKLCFKNILVLKWVKKHFLKQSYRTACSWSLQYITAAIHPFIILSYIN